jgi:osmotically-inducible protein OsmY
MAIADAQAAALVKTVLVNDPGLGGQTIEVRVVRGVALLSGRIRTQAEVDPAPGSR